MAYESLSIIFGLYEAPYSHRYHLTDSRHPKIVHEWATIHKRNGSLPVGPDEYCRYKTMKKPRRCKITVPLNYLRDD